MPNALLSGSSTLSRTLPQGHCHFFVGMWRLRHIVATLMGGKEGGDARISAIVRKWKILWYVKQKRGRGGFTAMLALSHSPGAPTGHGYDHIARSDSTKARISTTKQQLGNHFADVKQESFPDLPNNHLSTQKATSPHRNGRTTYEQDAQVWTTPPGAPVWAVRNEKKRSVLPKQGISGLRHSSSGSSQLPSLGRVTLFNEPSTRTSDAAITQGRLTLRHRHAFFQPQQRSPKYSTPPGSFKLWVFFFSTATLVPTLLGSNVTCRGEVFLAPPPPPPPST